MPCTDVIVASALDTAIQTGFSGFYTPNLDWKSGSRPLPFFPFFYILPFFTLLFFTILPRFPSLSPFSLYSTRGLVL